jgi:hypothetical protein
MDRRTRGGFGGRGIDAFVQCEFGGNPPLRTKVVHVSTSPAAKGKDGGGGGGGGLAAEFMEQLWIPVQAPTMSDRVALSLWDRDIFLPHKCVAHSYFSLKALPQLPQPAAGNGILTFFSAPQYHGPPPQWANLWGAASDLKGAKAGALENKYPDLASTYRGKLLVAMHVYTAPRKEEADYIHKKALPDLPAELYPKTALYTFRVSLLLGSELPVAHTLAADVGLGAASPVRVAVTFGPHRFSFSAQPVARGRAEWVETQEAVSLEMPAGCGALPDVGVYLLQGGGSKGAASKGARSVSFARIPAAKFLAEGFAGEPFWQKLHPDTSRQTSGRGGLGKSQAPGALLLRVGLGLSDGDAQPWRSDRVTVAATSACTVRVHVYQARHLPSRDANGLLDP